MTECPYCGCTNCTRTSAYQDDALLAQWICNGCNRTFLVKKP